MNQNTFVENILATRQGFYIEQLRALVFRIYLEAESVLGIHTVPGFKIARKMEFSVRPFLFLFWYFREWFKAGAKAELHPLFPAILEDQGFKTDEERILSLWHSFFKEKASHFFRNNPTLINLAVCSAFAEGENSPFEKLVEVLQSNLSELNNN